VVTARENYRYDAVGLPGITLANVQVTRCKACGETGVVIHRIEELHRRIANAVISKRDRLTPQEIRFLRKYLGLSGADFARQMGTTRETVSRWENGASSMGVIAERLLRLLVERQEPVKDYRVELAEVAVGNPKPIRLTLGADRRRGWETRKSA